MMKRIEAKQLWRVAAVAVVVMLLMVPTTGWAQSKPWAKFADGVLTFTYGAKPSDASTNAVKCSSCGKPIAAAHKFCPNCGTEKPKPKSFVFAVPLNAKDEDDIPWYERRREVKKVVIAQSFRQATTITSTACWFSFMNNLTNITGLENLRTGNMMNMYSMFFGCESLISLNVSNFNTSKVTNMRSMFNGCESLTSLNVSNFNTSKVTNMSGMFSDCKSLTSLNVSNFNTSNVTDMSWMFSSCERLTSLNVSNFNTSKVTDMRSMFNGSKSLTSLNISNFNTSKVTVMEDMFKECKSLTSLNISNFNTSNVTDMRWMFHGCTSLKTINVSSTTWDLNKAKQYRDEHNRSGTYEMFDECPAQVIKK